MLLLEGVSNFYKFKFLFLDKLENWSSKHLKIGTKQSPISVDDNNVVPKTLPPLEFHNYDKMFVPIVNNDGKHVEVVLSTKTEDSVGDIESIPYIKGGPLQGEYILKSIHFHWDSEHTINGRKFPLEAHFFHYSKDCSSVEEAMTMESGFCILSVLYEICKCENAAFDEISEAVAEVCDEVGVPMKCENEITCFNLLPKARDVFYTYEGSLTTPNYSENVIWIIMGLPGRIGRAQYKAITSITNETFEPIKNNSRNLQELNDREVTYVCSTFTKIRKKFQALLGTFI